MNLQVFSWSLGIISFSYRFKKTLRVCFKLQGLDWKGSLKVGFVQVLVTRKTSKVIEFSSCRGYRHGLKKIQGLLVLGISKIDKKKRFLVVSVFVRVST